MSSTIPATPDMSHYPPELLQQYLASVDKAEESDEAEWSDTDGTSEEEVDNALDSVAEQMKTLQITVPTDIESDDSGFSSEDEFSGATVLADLKIRKSLILGRPSGELQEWKAKRVAEYYLGYVKQLNDADTEMDEVLNGGGSASAAGTNTRSDDDASITELKKKTKAEIDGTERETVIRELVTLAQALFKKEKSIKKLVGAQGMPIIRED